MIEAQTTTDEPQVFEWRLDPKDAKTSIFLKEKCVEFAPIKQVYGFIKSNMGTSQTNTAFDTEHKHMISYKNTYDKKTGMFHTKHTLAKHKWGRITPVGHNSLCVLHRPTRHTLCEEAYVDLDIENAAPSIVREMMTQHNISCAYLTKYCEDPKKYQRKIMTHHNCSKDTAKKLIISILNGGKYAYWITKNDIQLNDNNPLKVASGVQDEMSSIIEIVYTNNQHIKKDVLKSDPTKWKTEKEAKRGVMALWLQTIEKMIQETCISHLIEVKEMKINEIVPCQDGLMILKEHYYDEICKDFEDVIKFKYNFNIKWKNKPFDEAIDIPIYTDVKTYNKWEDLLSVKCLADRFLEEFGEYIVMNGNNVYVYWNNDNPRWYDETIKNKRYKLNRLISENLYGVVSGEIRNAVELDTIKETPILLKQIRNQTCRGFNVNDIIFQILTRARSTEKEFDSQNHLLGFENGVYDLSVDEFRKYTFTDYITITTGYDYKPYEETAENIELMKVLDKIIEDIHPDLECRKLYLQTLASGLDGRAYQKIFLFNGGGGNGKGLTGALMDALLGGYYHQPGNGILKDIEKSNAPSPDMLNLKNKRYINFKEVSGSIKAAMLRNLTGGGKFCGRMLRCDPEHFFMSATFVMEFNTAPDLDGKPQPADYRRMVNCVFGSTFTDDENKIGKTIGGRTYMKGNKYFETQEFLQSMKYCFLHKLLGVYRENCDKINNTGIEFTIPESVKALTAEFIENQNLFSKVFNENYEKVEIIPDNKADEKLKTLKCRDIWSTIQFSDEFKALSFREKRQYSMKQLYLWLEEMTTITGNTKTGKLIVGYLPKEEAYLDVDSDAETENQFAGACVVGHTY